MHAKIQIGIAAALLALVPVCRGVTIPWGDLEDDDILSLTLVYQQEEPSENTFSAENFKYWAPQLKEDTLAAGTQVAGYVDDPQQLALGGGELDYQGTPSTGYYLIVAVRENSGTVASIDDYPYEAMWAWLTAEQLRNYYENGLGGFSGIYLEDLPNSAWSTHWLPVPEPCAAALFLLGAAGLALRRKRIA